MSEKVGQYKGIFIREVNGVFTLELPIGVRLRPELTFKTADEAADWIDDLYDTL